MAKKKKKSRGSRVLGSMGVKGVLIGTVLLAGAKYVLRRFFPQAGPYTTGASMTAAGLVAKSANVSGKSLVAPGVIELISEFVVDLVQPGGVYTMPGFGAARGGYDF